jgi:uncharacterized protein (DUF3820 family)
MSINWLSLISIKYQQMTENITIEFGKHKGELWTRVPVHYLRWLINESSPLSKPHEMARFELERRGTVLEHEINLTPHAIDRFYQRYKRAGLSRSDILGYGGIYSALMALSIEALKLCNGGPNKVEYKGLKFIFYKRNLDTILKTVM